MLHEKPAANTNNTHDDGNGDELIRQKISLLCRSAHDNGGTQLWCVHESFLCAALLWTRAQEDATFCNIATDESTRILVPFVSHLLTQLVACYSELSNDRSNTSFLRQQPQQQELLARLAIQLLTRLYPLQRVSSNVSKAESTVKGRQQHTIIQEAQHWHVFLTILRRRRALGSPIEPIDVEIAGALRDSFPDSMLETTKEEQEFVGNSKPSQPVLVQLWEIYEASMTHLPSSKTSEKKDETSERRDDFGDDDEDSLMMVATLEALIQPTTSNADNGSKNSKSNRGSDDEWHENMWEVFQQQCIVDNEEETAAVQMQLLSDLCAKELAWWSNHKHAANATIRIKWTWLVLYTLDWMAESNDTIDQWGSFLEGEPSTAASLVNLLLAAVVSPNHQEIPTLQPLAWSVARHQWKPLLGKLGLNRQICSFLKLAVGEWNIQLEMALQDYANTKKGNSEKPGNDEPSPVLALLQSCGQIISQTIEWLGQVDQETDGHAAADNMSKIGVTKSSIRHVQKSLELALDLCVQFFQVDDDDDGKSVPHDAALVVSAVFGSLLTEFDVFTHKFNKQDEMTEDSSQETSATLIQTLGKCMAATATSEIIPNQQQRQQQQQRTLVCLIPAVTTVLASAQGDSERVNCLRKQSDEIVALLDAFWRRKEVHSNGDAMVWTCQLMELFVEMYPLSETVAINWKRCLLEFLKSNNTGGKDKASPPALQAALGCFVQLQGEQAPEGPEADIIHTTLSSLQQV